MRSAEAAATAGEAAAPDGQHDGQNDGGRRPRSALIRRRMGWLQTPPAALTLMMGLYVIVFGRLTWEQQSHYGTFGFDMGIYDQGIWLLSRFRTPFVTIRGLNYFGHHVNLITLLLVPAYWLGAGPHFLYLVETVALASGAIPIWLLARDKLANAWLALGFAISYLLYPSLEWINWWHFHPDALIIPALLWSWWFATRRRWTACLVAAGIAMLCKEDACLAVMMLGLLIALRERKRLGYALAVAGAAWFAICVRLIIPTANGGGGAFYEASFPTLGHSVTQIIASALRHPSRVARLVAAKSRHTYYVQILVPVAFVALGSTVTLIALPQILANVSSNSPYTHDIHYHYSSVVIVGVFLGTIEACAYWASSQPARRFVTAAVCAFSLAANVAWSPSPISVKYHSGVWARGGADVAIRDRLVRAIPHGAGVTASYSIVTHLTHRAHIYEWPNPFIVGNWGLDNTHPDPVANVDWLLLDTNITDHKQLLDQLTAPGGPFRVTTREGPFLVARRVMPGPSRSDIPPGS